MYILILWEIFSDKLCPLFFWVFDPHHLQIHVLLYSKIPPTYPWKIPRMFNQQFIKEFLSLWGFGEVWGIFSGYVGKIIALSKSESSLSTSTWSVFLFCGDAKGLLNFQREKTRRVWRKFCGASLILRHSCVNRNFDLGRSVPELRSFPTESGRPPTLVGPMYVVSTRPETTTKRWLKLGGFGPRLENPKSASWALIWIEFPPDWSHIEGEQGRHSVFFNRKSSKVIFGMSNVNSNFFESKWAQSSVLRGPRPSTKKGMKQPHLRPK